LDFLETPLTHFVGYVAERYTAEYRERTKQRKRLPECEWSIAMNKGESKNTVKILTTVIVGLLMMISGMGCGRSATVASALPASSAQATSLPSVPVPTSTPTTVIAPVTSPVSVPSIADPTGTYLAAGLASSIRWQVFGIRQAAGAPVSEVLIVIGGVSSYAQTIRLYVDANPDARHFSGLWIRINNSDLCSTYLSVTGYVSPDGRTIMLSNVPLDNNCDLRAGVGGQSLILTRI
jgi:hypothetical protein